MTRVPAGHPFLEALLMRFNPNHDPETGQFSSGDGGGSSGSVEPTERIPSVSAANAAKPKPAEAHTAPSTSFAFVSPSVASHLDFPEAVEAIKSDQQRELREASVYINGALGSRAQEYDVVGAWADGAENSTMDIVTGSDWDKLTLAASMKGWLADQKQVLIFQESPGGQAAMAHFEATGELADIHNGLLQDGVAFHTLVPHAGGATVYVADLDGSALDSIKKAAARYDAEVGIKFGRAEFLGTVKQDGTDREQRDDARAIYEGNIRQSQVAGHDAIWQRVRDRWGQGIHQAPVGAGTSASALFDKYNDPAASAEAITASVPGATVAVETAERNLNGVPHTDAPATEGGFKNADGTYLPEREALHEHILDEMFTPDAVLAATPLPGNKPVMTILGGRGGSGKSWFTKQGIADAAHAIYINADDIQAKLPGYEGWNAALYHEEASDITKRADDRARALGVSVIHDATMRTPGGSAKRVSDYKAAGYAVHGHYMFLPPQTSTKRALERFVRGGTEGRYVPVSYLLNSTTNERTFDSLKPSFDQWSVYENTGSAPKLVSAGEQQAKRDGRYSKRVVRTRSEPAGRRDKGLLAGEHGARAASHRTAEASATAEEVTRRAFSPIIAYTEALFARYNENHDPDNGQFTSGDGGGSSSSTESSNVGKDSKAGGSGSGGGRPAGSASVEQAQAAAATAAAGATKLTGLPEKPIKLGNEYYVPGPIGRIQTAAADYMKSAGLKYDPPTEYIKVDPEHAKRIADAFEHMKHDPNDPAVKASYAALAKEVIAQWQAVKATGLKVEWIKPGQEDPYADSPRRAAMDVALNNHWWGFPTDMGFGNGSEEAEKAREDNPMLAETDEVIDGRKCCVNDLFRIVHDYFGHFKNGVGFRADGEDNAWRSHLAMFSEAARGAMTSETRGQNSWVNFGPYGETNKHANAAETHYAPQKVGLMPSWTWDTAASGAGNSDQKH